MTMGMNTSHKYPCLLRPRVPALVETHLEDCRIPAFNIGGELRLCLPQVIARVLPGVSLADIQLTCDRLCIICRRGTQEQAALLQLHLGALDSASSCNCNCGLIRQSDAERLCKTLLAPQLTRLSKWMTGGDPGGEGVAVRHKCFGKQSGTLLPQLFKWPSAPCIVCTGCSCLLSPAQFVGHSHGSREVAATCHWGFDSANWRLYLHLDWRRASPSGAAALEMVKATVWVHDFAPNNRNETVLRQVQGERRTRGGYFKRNTSFANLQLHCCPQQLGSSDTIQQRGRRKRNKSSATAGGGNTLKRSTTATASQAENRKTIGHSSSSSSNSSLA